MLPFFFNKIENYKITRKEASKVSSAVPCCAQLLSRSNSLRSHQLWSARLLCPQEFSRQEYWSGLPCPPPGDLPNPGIKPRSPRWILYHLSRQRSSLGTYINFKQEYLDLQSIMFFFSLNNNAFSCLSFTFGFKWYNF